MADEKTADMLPLEDKDIELQTRSMSVADHQKAIGEAVEQYKAEQSVAHPETKTAVTIDTTDPAAPTAFPAFKPQESESPFNMQYWVNGRWKREPLAMLCSCVIYVIVFAIFQALLADHLHNCWDECAEFCEPYGSTFFRYSFVLTLYGSVGILPRIFGLWHQLIYDTKAIRRFAGVPQEVPSVIPGKSGWWQTFVFAVVQVVVTLLVNAGLKEGHTITFPLGLIGLPLFFSLLFGGIPGAKRYSPYLAFGALISLMTSALIWLFPLLEQSLGRTGFDAALALLPFLFNFVEFLFLDVVERIPAMAYWSDEEMSWLSALLLIGIQSIWLGMLLNIHSPGLTALNIILHTVLDFMDRIDGFRRIVYKHCFNMPRKRVARLESIYMGCKVYFDIIPILAYLLMAAFNYSPSGGSAHLVTTMTLMPEDCTSTPLIDKYQLSTTWPVIVGLTVAQFAADFMVYTAGRYLFTQKEVEVLKDEIRTKGRVIGDAAKETEALSKQLDALKAKGEHESAKYKELETKYQNATKRLTEAASPKSAEEKTGRRASLIVAGLSPYRFGGEGLLVQFDSFWNLLALMTSSFFFAILGLEGAGIVLKLIEKQEIIP